MHPVSRVCVCACVCVFGCRLSSPSEEAVDMLHRRYFTALWDVFEQKKEEAGHADQTLGFDAPFDKLSEAEWKQYEAALQEDPVPSEDRVHTLFADPSDAVERVFTGFFWTVVFSCIFLRAAIHMEESFLDGLFS